MSSLRSRRVSQSGRHAADKTNHYGRTQCRCRLQVTVCGCILELERKHPNRMISVSVPELVERRWYYFLLHNQRAGALKVMLDLKGSGRIVVINVPWYLRS
jgi:hypothetical protein